VRVYPTRFRPTASNFSGKTIEGVRFVVTERESFDSTRLGLEVAVALEKLYPGHIDLQKCRFLIGNRRFIEKLQQSGDASSLWTAAQADATAFAARRKQFLLYQAKLSPNS